MLGPCSNLNREPHADCIAVLTTAPSALIHTVILDGLSVLDTENITCRLVSDVWRRRRRSRRSTRAGHDVAGPGLD